MHAVTTKQYLEFAMEHSGEAVLDAAYSDLHYVKGKYFLRAIFPCFIFQNQKNTLSFPDYSHCNYVFAIMEQEVDFVQKKFVAKFRQKLARHESLRIEVARCFLKELFPDVLRDAQSIQEIFSLVLGKKECRLTVNAAAVARTVDFCWSTNRTTVITSTCAEFPPPAKQLMRKCSKEVYRLYFKQFFQPQQKEDSFFHRGWLDSGAVPFYFGFSQLRSEDTLPDGEKGELPEFLCEAEQLLSLVPYSVSIPLFSFALFSILKYFYPGYPSRISVHNSYQYVKRNLEKILFLSLECKNKSFAQEAAELYCGTFLRHSLPGTPAREEESRYIHDGVVIVSENFKNRVKITEKNLDTYIIRDACALFVNLPLPVNASLIRIVADVDGSTVDSINLKAYRERVDTLLQCFIQFLERYPRQTMGDSFKKHLEENPEKLSKVRSSEQLAIWRDAFFKWYKNSMERGLDCAKAHLKGLSADKPRTKKCIYLLSSYLIFMDFIKYFDMGNSSEQIDRLCQVGISEFQRICRGYSWLDRMKGAFAAYVSELLENGVIAPVRGFRTENTFGWFDPKKQQLLLQYSSYYERFLRFYQKKYGEELCCTKGEFQTDFLAQYGFIQMKPNGKQGSYQRADCRIEVAPVGEESKKERVVKISVESFRTLAPLSQKAEEEIKRLSGQTTKRRVSNRCRKTD